ncbi:hypothetical protein F5884DRAFT_777895 [Xylogone sp. PMI_703]|nr:hypothetical protein F5884DRAFT_777895 [Xylogone sp. PMI_703]
MYSEKDSKKGEVQNIPHESQGCSSQSYQSPVDLSLYHEIQVENSFPTNLVLKFTSSSTSRPQIHVENSCISPSKPSVTLRQSDKNGPVLAIFKLGWARNNTFGLGDPISNSGSKEVVWEGMRKTSNWRHGTWQFEFGNGRERRTYVWQRTSQFFLADQPNLELRPASQENSGRQEETEPLGVYTGRQGFATKRRGVFYIKRGYMVGSHKELNQEWSDWELAVLVTGLGIIEGARRRSRHRRC